MVKANFIAKAKANYLYSHLYLLRLKDSLTDRRLSYSTLSTEHWRFDLERWQLLLMKRWATLNRHLKQVREKHETGRVYALATIPRNPPAQIQNAP